MDGKNESDLKLYVEEIFDESDVNDILMESKPAKVLFCILRMIGRLTISHFEENHVEENYYDLCFNYYMHFTGIF